MNDFYFQCVAIRTSKRVAGDIKKAAKEANRLQQMETEFQPNEQSIKDMVTHEVEKEVSKLQTAKNKQSSCKPTNDKGPCRTPDPHPEEEIKPNLVRARMGKQHKRDKVARE